MQATMLASTRLPTARGTACCVQANCQGRHHRSALRLLNILLHTFGGQFCVPSAETHLDTSFSLLLSTRYFCAGSLWHIKQLSAHRTAKCLQDGAEWLIVLQISMIIKILS